MSNMADDAAVALQEYFPHMVSSSSNAPALLGCMGCTDSSVQVMMVAYFDPVLRRLVSCTVSEVSSFVGSQNLLEEHDGINLKKVANRKEYVEEFGGLEVTDYMGSNDLSCDVGNYLVINMDGSTDQYTVADAVFMSISFSMQALSARLSECTPQFDANRFYRLHEELYFERLLSDGEYEPECISASRHHRYPLICFEPSLLDEVTNPNSWQPATPDQKEREEVENMMLVMYPPRQCVIS